MQITSTFGQQAAKAVGDYADTQRVAAIELRTRAAQESDPAKQVELYGQAQTLENNWGPNGTLRIAAQGVVAGLTGGLAGALGAVSGALTAPAIADALAAANINGPLASAITAAASTALGECSEAQQAHLLRSTRLSTTTSSTAPTGAAVMGIV